MEPSITATIDELLNNDVDDPMNRKYKYVNH